MELDVDYNKAADVNTESTAYQKAVMSAPTFGIKDKLGYLFGDLGFNTLQVLVNTYLMIYFVNIVGISPVHFSIIIAVCKASDAINDPFIGRVVDKKLGSKHGKYKQFILWYLIPYVVSTILLFINMDSMSYGVKIAYALFTYFIWGIVGTFINVPYGAMLSAITTDLKGRTDLSNFRSIGSLMANVITTSVAPLILFDSMDNPVASNFFYLSVVLGIFALICMFLTHVLVSERIIIPDKTESEKNENYFQIMKSFYKNRPMIAVILAYIIVKFFIQTIGIMNQYVFMNHFRATDQLAAIGLGTMIPTFAAMLVVNPMVKRFGKKNLVTWPALLGAVFFGINAVFPVSSTLYIVFQLIGQFFVGFFSLLVWSLIADAVDYQVYLTKERNDGTIYATITFLVFLVSSLSTSMIAILLEMIGYNSDLGVNQLAGVAEAIKGLGGILPAIGAVLIFVCFHFIYNLTDEQMQKISPEVNELNSQTINKGVDILNSSTNVQLNKKITQINDNTWNISDYYLDNYYLAVGDDYAALIDTGAGIGNIIDDVRKITDKPLKVLLTHGHLDHLGGMYAFEKAYMHPKDDDLYREHYPSLAMRQWYVETRVPVRFPGEGHVEALLDLLPEEDEVKDLFTYHPIEEGDTFDLGNRILEVIETPGHSPGHVSYLDHQNRILFSGDTINDSIIIFDDENNLKSQHIYNESLNKLWNLKDKFDILLVGHEEPVMDKQAIKDYLDLSNGILDGSLQGRYEEVGIRKGEVVRKNNIELWYKCKE